MLLPKNFFLLRLTFMRGSKCFLNIHRLKGFGLQANYSCIARSFFIYNCIRAQQFDLTAKRGVRNFPKGMHDKEEERHKKVDKEKKNERSGIKEEDPTVFLRGTDKRESPSPAEVKKVRRLMIYFALTATALTFWLFSRPEFAQIYNPSDPIGMNELLQTYLPSGEVKRILYIGNQNQAIVILHSGAVIQGKLVNKSFVVVQCRPGETVTSFTREIRERERDLGIPQRMGILIENQDMWSGTSYLILLVSMLLIGYLSARMTHQVLKRLMETKSSGKMKKR